MDSEARYRVALSAGRMGSWETDFVTRTRTWSPEGMALFGLALADGRGQVGGPGDEYETALHPEDRRVLKDFHELADRVDSFPAEYRIVTDAVVVRHRVEGELISFICLLRKSVSKSTHPPAAPMSGTSKGQAALTLRTRQRHSLFTSNPLPFRGVGAPTSERCADENVFDFHSGQRARTAEQRTDECKMPRRHLASTPCTAPRRRK